MPLALNRMPTASIAMFLTGTEKRSQDMLAQELARPALMQSEGHLHATGMDHFHLALLKYQQERPIDEIRAHFRAAAVRLTGELAVRKEPVEGDRRNLWDFLRV